MFIISAMETSLLKKIIIPLFMLSLLLLVLVPIIGVEVKGAKRWLNFYLFRLQPIEILKPFFILVTVKILTFDKLKNSQLKYFLSFLLLAIIITFLIDQPDLGQSILLIGSWYNSFCRRCKCILYFHFYNYIYSCNWKSFIFYAGKIWIYNKPFDFISRSQ